MTSENTISLCNTCDQEATKICTQCRRVHYCSLDCQKADWKAHKKQCFPIGAKCTRCLEIIDPAKPCRVPHPIHMLEDAGSMYGGTCSWSFGCKACGSSFTKTSSDSNAMKSAPITRGPEYCYVGSHSIKPIQEHDQRRVRDDTLVLYTGPDLQSQINQIPSTHPNVSVLTIQSHSGFYDDSVEYSLEVAMPKLTKVQLIDVSFSHVKLDNELTPLVEELFMQNIPDECNLTVLLPELKSFTMFYYGPTENEEWISKMLTTAKKLKTFESYKLRVGELHFASNELETIRLHRAELMCYLSVYAPKLKMLNLQACYDLNEIKLLDEHPNFIKPAGAGSKFTVDTTNACITRSIANTLEQNPRVEWIGRDDDDDMMFGY